MRAFTTLLALASLLATTSAFVASPVVRPVVAVSRQPDASAITMARNPMKADKKRRIRLKALEKGRVRLNVFRSNQHIYAQVIDDSVGHTLCSASSKSLGLEQGANKDAAKQVGLALAEAAKAKDIGTMWYDRSSSAHTYRYHGRIASLVDGVREGGVTI